MGLSKTSLDIQKQIPQINAHALKVLRETAISQQDLVFNTAWSFNRYIFHQMHSVT